MKKIVLFLLVIITISCSIPYDGETIITLNLKVVNTNNEPLANQKCYLGYYYYPTYRKTSNNEGIIKFNMFLPKESQEIYFEESTEYLPVSIGYLNSSNFNSLEWNLGNLILFKSDEIIPFTLLINSSSSKTLEKLEVAAIKYENRINLSNDVGYYFEPQMIYELKKNQNFELKYQLRNNETNEIEFYTIPLVANETAFQYTLTY